MTTTIHLIRHGQTDANAHNPPILQGQGDYPLNDTGRSQAAAIGRKLSSRPITAVFASPLSRAVETASNIAEHHGLPVSTDDDLKEVHVGEWEGLSWDDVLERDPQTYARVMKNGGDTPYPAGESYPQVAARSVAAIESIASNHGDGELVVVAHRVVNRCVAAKLMGLDLRRSKDLAQDNTSHNVLTWDGSKLKLQTLNDVSHLGDLG